MKEASFMAGKHTLEVGDSFLGPQGVGSAICIWRSGFA